MPLEAPRDRGLTELYFVQQNGGSRGWLNKSDGCETYDEAVTRLGFFRAHTVHGLRIVKISHEVISIDTVGERK